MDTERRALPERLPSLDAFRGFVVLAMASAGFGLAEIAARVESNGEASWIGTFARQFVHVPWRGGVFWDLIQPSFVFIVGVAMTFSHEARSRRGQSFGRQLAHALGRSFVLVVLGVFLASAHATETQFTFTNVLAQIGLGYGIVFLLLRCPAWVRVLALGAILAGDWALFAFYPLPGPNLVFQLHGLGPNWQWQTGFAAHWEKNLNVAADFDRWFLNQFPRSTPFLFNEGGYQTLNFLPAMATMLAGTLAGDWLRSRYGGAAKVVGLFLAGAACLMISTAIDPVTSTSSPLDSARWVLCPIVKRLHTPSWVIYSTAWTCWMMAAFYLIIDVWGFRRWAFPLVVVGMNSIAIYMMTQLLADWVGAQLQTHGGTLFGWLHDRFGLSLSRDPFAGLWGPFHESLAILAVFWLIALWLYRRRIFVRV